MSKETRNTPKQRKSVKNSRMGGESTPAPRRAARTRVPQAITTPQSPKKGQQNGQSGGREENRSRSSRNKGPEQRRDGHGSGGRSRSGRSGGGREGSAGWTWGAHACTAVLANPKRTIHQVMMTDTAAMRFGFPDNWPDNAPIPKIVLPGMMDRQFDGSSHQGIAMKCAPLEWPALEDIIDSSGDDGLILVLDQITDPHNVGAMLRLCSAFGVSALVMQDRKAPPLSGATAKVAVGCLETVPVCLVTNIANTLQALQKANWMVTGLAGETELPLDKALSGGGKHVIVMGAEGPGLRERVMQSCDQLARIPMMSKNVAGEAESLNVATAAGIALYEARRREVTAID